MSTTKKAAAKKLSGAEVELRRWCIEQAARWPTYAEHYGGALGGYGGAVKHTEVDLIGRAERLLKWVTS